MKKIFTLLFCAVVCIGSCWGEYVTIGSTSGTTTASPLVAGNKYSVCQQKYTKSELNNAGLSTSEGINAIAFYYAANAAGGTQNVEIYLTLDNNYDNFGNYLDPVSTQQKVFDGTITLPSTPNWYKINLDKTSVVWNGTSKSLMVTIVNKSTSAISGASHYCYTGTGRQAHKESTWSKIDAPTTTSVSATKTNDVPQIRFYFGTEPAGPAAPTNVQASNVTYNSANISWTGVDGADSYSLQYKKSDTSSYTTINNITETSYSLSGLDASTTYVFGVKTIKGSESSDFTADANFTTLAEPVHTHNDITFTKWTETNSLPKSGNYYLENNVSMSNTWEIDGTLNLCFNGRTINLKGNYANIDQELAIFDCVGTGKITSTNASYGTLSVFSGGGSLTLNNCSIENTGSGDYATAVKVNGSASFYMNGAVKLNATNADINLFSTGSAISFTATKKPSQPTSPYSIYRLSGVLTNGWANMGDVDPADYFVSANSSYSIAKNADGELELMASRTISETSTSSITPGPANVTLIRTLVANTYNTICLPFAVTSGQITEQFGDGTKVQDLTEATLSSNDMDLALEFTEVTAMEAGKPYLIMPTSTKSSYTFNNVTLTNSVAEVSFDNVDFVGTFNQQASLPIVDKNILLMGTENTLFWATNDGGFKGLRAYFKITYHGTSAPARLNTRMTFNESQVSTRLDNVNANVNVNSKMLIDGKLVIIKNGRMFNALGTRL